MSTTPKFAADFIREMLKIGASEVTVEGFGSVRMPTKAVPLTRLVPDPGMSRPPFTPQEAPKAADGAAVRAEVTRMLLDD